ncbi:MAG: GerMN domain-containing protein [Clostridia bacterium]|nr:GerMN domain-containing protein [Clostridia bacterium]
MNLKNKRILIICGVVVIVIAIIILICCNIGVEKIENNVVENEIIPEEEISDEQLRETTINLYFVNENNEIAEEIRKVDSKILLNNPYSEVMNLLLSGPKSDNLKSVIPENVRVNSIQKSGECLIIDFSKEFIENQVDDVEIHGLVISQIVDTMTQFTEINAIKILIEGEQNQCFKNGNISFEQLFTKED